MKANPFWSVVLRIYLCCTHTVLAYLNMNMGTNNFSPFLTLKSEVI